MAGHIILGRLQDWAETNNILSDLQYGFRFGLGTTEQAINLDLLIGKYVHIKGGNLFLVFVDLSSAFDFVAHNKLWSVMANMGMDCTIVNFLRD